MNAANNSKFATRKWNIVNDNSKPKYEEENEISYNTEVLKFNLSDYNNAYILEGGITATTSPQIQVVFKNCAPFSKCITKIEEATIDDAEDLDLVMPMIEYSSNYSETTGNLLLYSIDEESNFNENNLKQIITNVYTNN